MTLEADQAVQEARFAGACQDQHAGRPAPSLGWPGERKSNKCRFLKGNQSRLRRLGPSFQGLGAQGLWPGPPRPWGRGLQGLGARAPMLGLGFFIVVKKSLGGRQAKGWETAETAAAEAWREAGTGYPPYPPPPGPFPRRVSRL